MNNEDKTPPGFVRDPFDGKTLLLKKTPCTRERRLFFKRLNEIMSFLATVSYSFYECRNKLKIDIPTLPKKENTPIKIGIPGGRGFMLSAATIKKMTREGNEILSRQVFTMVYGSFETYLFQLFERTYPLIGITENRMDHSIGILMGKSWDGKFNKMNDAFDINYRAGELINFFKKWPMSINGKSIKHPLDFLDNIARYRHRIIHASSIFENILDNDNTLNIEFKYHLAFLHFYYLLTDYVDMLFSKKYKYPRKDVDPSNPNLK